MEKLIEKVFKHICEFGFCVILSLLFSGLNQHWNIIAKEYQLPIIPFWVVFNINLIILSFVCMICWIVRYIKED